VSIYIVLNIDTALEMRVTNNVVTARMGQNGLFSTVSPFMIGEKVQMVLSFHIGVNHTQQTLQRTATPSEAHVQCRLNLMYLLWDPGMVRHDLCWLTLFNKQIKE